MAGTCECGNEPSGSINAGNLTSCKLVSFSRRTLFHGVSKCIESNKTTNTTVLTSVP